MNIMNKVTLKGLLKNKTRTIVTIIGVILSTSMFTAVTTFISSLQNYIIDFTVAEEGSWHGSFYDIDEKEYLSLMDKEGLGDIALTRNMGYGMLEESINQYKPYLRMIAVDEKAFELLPIRLIEGRLPENNNEILVSDHIRSNGGVEYSIGDELFLELGDRVLDDGTIVTNQNAYIVGENEEIIESIEVKDSGTYKVVGISKRLSHEFEGYNEPGYSLITIMDKEDMEGGKFNAYAKVRNPKNTMKLVESLAKELGIEKYNFNSQLLRYMGISDNSGFNGVLYSLAAVLTALIMLGSISLIYNSFSISLSERVKQFGMLSSVGATAKQRRNSVFFEAVVIAGIGIPLGVLAGIAGIGTTLYLLRGQLSSFLPNDYSVTLSLSVSVGSVIIAVLIAITTILISASIPARRSKRISAMDAIRQTTDIKLTSKKVKTSRLTGKLFGLEGNIALKNLKRNRRRYRSTVLSLFISIVLFVSASSFGMYLKDSVENVYENTDYDLAFYNYQYSGKVRAEIDKGMYKDILALDEVLEGSIIKRMNANINIDKEDVGDIHYKNMVELGIVNDGEALNVEALINFVDHDTFIEYLGEIGLEEEEVNNKDIPSSIVIDKQHYYNYQQERYNNIKLLKDDSLNSFIMEYVDENNLNKELEVEIAAVAEEAPFGLDDYTYMNVLTVIADESLLDTSYIDLQDQWYTETLLISAENPVEAEEAIKKILMKDEDMFNTLGISNVAEQIQVSRNIITIINVFAYGFIVLISLITIANVFNTISTNVNLRRREFAMLKSVGMTNSSFNKMLNYECIFYGLKALLYGLPVSIGVTYLIYKSIENGVDMAFYLPSSSILISILSVFLVVFISMMYSMSKIRKENILDGLKKENL
ncbi:MAG TPA: ABC transporter permease [Clostridiales bacterium]|nr:ABC transporter permease [Clostridiales bacterium]